MFQAPTFTATATRSCLFSCCMVRVPQHPYVLATKPSTMEVATGDFLPDQAPVHSMLLAAGVRVLLYHGLDDPVFVRSYETNRCTPPLAHTLTMLLRLCAWCQTFPVLGLPLQTPSSGKVRRTLLLHFAYLGLLVRARSACCCVAPLELTHSAWFDQMGN